MECLLAMSKSDRENMGIETKGCGETHFYLRRLTVVEKSFTNKCQSKNSTPAMLCLCKNNDVATSFGIYIEGEARQATYTLNCYGQFTRARFGHSEVFEKRTNEWPSLLAPARTKLFLLLLLEEGF
jgi:hypothetical protein